MASTPAPSTPVASTPAGEAAAAASAGVVRGAPEGDAVTCAGTSPASAAGSAPPAAVSVPGCPAERRGPAGRT
ncbi:hypothetical protein [Sinomonas sp. RB5]